MNPLEILLAILMAFGLILNVLLAISVVRTVSSIQKRFDLREELDGIWRNTALSRIQNLENWRRQCAQARRTQINNGGTQK